MTLSEHIVRLRTLSPTRGKRYALSISRWANRLGTSAALALIHAPCAPSEVLDAPENWTVNRGTERTRTRLGGELQSGIRLLRQLVLGLAPWPRAGPRQRRVSVRRHAAQEKHPERCRRRRPKVPQSLRQAVWDRDVGDDKRTGACVVCARTVKMEDFHASHVEAVARGGETHLDNLRVCCPFCNCSMGDRNLTEFAQHFR